MDTAKLVEGTDLPDLTAHSIHRGIYRYRPDINSVMHTHCTYSTVLSVLEDPEIKMIHQNSTRFFNNVAYDTDFDGVPADGQNDESERLGSAIGDKDVLLMGNHGLITTGNTVAEAFDAHYYFEKAAQVQVLAYQTGKPLSLLKMEAVMKTNKVFAEDSGYAHAHFYGMQKTLMREDPKFLKK